MNLLSASQTLWDFVQNRLRSRSAHRRILEQPGQFSSVPTGEGTYRTALYFADDMLNAYQARQWYEPLRELSEHFPIVVITRNAETSVQLQRECPLPIYFAKTITDIERLIDSQRIDMVFYVNQNIRNFQMLRFNRPAHVFISHGESEKAYMWSNQLNAYDYVFSAGEAAKERIATHLRRFNVDTQCKLIGRPQIDVAYSAPISLNKDYPTVLYAPTWEGDRPSMSYGSVASHGVELVTALIASGRYNVIVRPHPRSGVNSANYAKALDRISETVAASSTEQSPTYYFDQSPQWGWQWAMSDLCVTDISAAAYDFMSTGKPLVITTPASGLATVHDSPALTRVPALASSESSGIVPLVDRMLATPDSDYKDLVKHYFGDTSSGASMRRFIDAALEVMHEVTESSQMD